MSAGRLNILFLQGFNTMNGRKFLPGGISLDLSDNKHFLLPPLLRLTSPVVLLWMMVGIFSEHIDRLAFDLANP
jgi:hypothetical protein